MTDSAQEGPSPRTYRLVLVLIGGYAAALAVAMPFATLPAPRVPAITTFVVGGVLPIELTISFLLLVRFRDARRWPLLPLAAAYLWSAVVAVFHLLSFPDTMLPGTTVLGTTQSASWTYQLWVDGYAVLTLVSVIAEAAGGGFPMEPRRARFLSVLVPCLTAAFACAGAVAVTVFVDRLPVMYGPAGFTSLNEVLNDMGVVMLAIAVAIVLLVIRERSRLYLWLCLAMTALLSSNVVSLYGGTRYTVGWTVGRLGWIASACALFLFFVYQFARQQGTLARARASLEQNVEDRTADLVRTVRQRDLLLREVYHRTKNNLQVVNSLIDMEARRLEDGAARQALADLRNRVHTIGLVHQQLMASESLADVTMAPFLRELSRNVVDSFGVLGRRVTVTLAADDVAVHLDFAISVGLLATELLSNAIRHALATLITLEFRLCPDGRVLLSVVDDGVPADVAPDPVGARSGIGDRIIMGLTKQLDGEMTVTHLDGIHVEIRMPLPTRV